MVFDRLAFSDSIAPVEVYADGVEEGEDCNNGECTCDHEGQGCGLGAEVEERGCDSADVDGVLEL